MVGPTQRGDDGGARGRHELAGDRCGREGDIARLDRLTTAGAGMGMRPWAQWMVPWPSESDSTTISSMPRSSRQMATEQTSTMESTALLVEHDGLGRFAVGLGLGGGERGKDGERTTLGAIA